MTVDAASAQESAMEARWREWKARGATSDQRSARIASRVFLLVALALTISLLVQLV